MEILIIDKKIIPPLRRMEILIIDLKKKIPLRGGWKYVRNRLSEMERIKSAGGCFYISAIMIKICLKRFEVSF